MARTSVHSTAIAKRAAPRMHPLYRMILGLADHGVPRSVVREVVGVEVGHEADASPAQVARLMALAQLAAVYHGISEGKEASIRELGQAWQAAVDVGVWYDPPESVVYRLGKRAAAMQAAAGRLKAGSALPQAAK